MHLLPALRLPIDFRCTITLKLQYTSSEEKIHFSIYVVFVVIIVWYGMSRACSLQSDGVIVTSSTSPYTGASKKITPEKSKVKWNSKLYDIVVRIIATFKLYKWNAMIYIC